MDTHAFVVDDPVSAIVSATSLSVSSNKAVGIVLVFLLIRELFMIMDLFNWFMHKISENGH